jgi:cytochrome c-type biogenesis protein CcmH
MTFDANTWGPPLAVVLAGAAAGAFLYSRSRTTREEAARIAVDGRIADLKHHEAAVIETLKTLELERTKLSEVDYQRERAALLASGASALRELEETATGKDTAPPSPLPRRGLAPEWKGAFLTLGIQAVIAVLIWMASGQAVDRQGGAPITGRQGEAALDPEEARLLAIVEANPKDVDAWNQLTNLALSKPDAPTAMQYNERALALEPRNADAQVHRAVLRALIGMGDGALALLDEVLAEHPEHPRALMFKGLILRRMDRSEEAIPILERAIAADPESAAFLQPEIEKAHAETSGATADPSTPTEAAVAEGMILASPAAEAFAGSAEALFVSIRDPAGGPPIGALKLPPGPFPVRFRVTEANRLPMAGNRPWPDPFDIAVRLDLDGDAASRNDAEPAATMKGVSRGATGLSVALQ